MKYYFYAYTYNGGCGNQTCETVRNYFHIREAQKSIESDGKTKGVIVSSYKEMSKEEYLGQKEEK